MNIQLTLAGVAIFAALTTVAILALLQAFDGHTITAPIITPL